MIHSDVEVRDWLLSEAARYEDLSKETFVIAEACRRLADEWSAAFGPGESKHKKRVSKGKGGSHEAGRTAEEKQAA